MYRANHIHNNDLKFNPTELKKKPEEEKDKQETNSKDHETLRKLMKATNKPKQKHNISSILYQW